LWGIVGSNPLSFVSYASFVSRSLAAPRVRDSYLVAINHYDASYTVSLALLPQLNGSPLQENCPT